MRSDPHKKRSCILVLGMHRAGTSAFTRVLSLLGGGLPQKILEAGADNPSGFWEPEEIVDLNNTLLSDVGSAWYDWRPIDFSVPDISRIVESYESRISEVIRQNFGEDELVILKDPRICRLAPLYERALDQASFETKFLVPIRHPTEVAKSLEIRNGMPRSQGILLWLRHVLEAEQSTRGKPRSFVLYDALLENWEASLKKIAFDLGLSWARSYDEAAAEVGEFLNSDLKHHDADVHQGATPDDKAGMWAEEVYALLSEPLSTAALKRLDSIREQLDFVSPIVFSHHSQLVAMQPQAPDRYLRPLAEISDTIKQIRSHQARFAQETEARVKLLENAAVADELARLLQENDALSKNADTLLSEIESVTQAHLTAEQTSAQLAEQIASLQQELSRLSAEAQAASAARKFAEDRCAELAERYWVGGTNAPAPEVLSLSQSPNRSSPLAAVTTESENDGSHHEHENTSAPPEVETMNDQSFGQIYAGMTYDVVIPVHNSVHWLAMCLEELFKSKSRNIGEVIVVDDRSQTDQSAQAKQIVSRFPSARLIENTGSYGGFGHACNMGAAAGNSPLIVFLNTDCLVTEHSLDLLSETLTGDDSIALACPFSNNSPLLTYPMFPGRSYIDMSEFMRAGNSHTSALEACTIVGNCLMVKRNFFETVGGFAPEWREGYGEETELQMKAMRYGLKGVVDPRSYVFHFGGGTFNYLEGTDQLRLSNHKRFMAKWRKEFAALQRRVRTADPLQIVDANLRGYFRKHPEKEWPIDIDVLFYLPGLRQDIGGLSAVVAICNALVRSGVKATCALVGPGSLASASSFKEPILFNFLTYLSDSEFLKDTVVRPKIVFSTIFTSAEVVAEFAAARNCIAAQFVQGYEPFFENGKRRPEALKSYQTTDLVVTTSSWLASMVARNLNDKQQLLRLPLLPNPDIFFSGTNERDIDVCVVIRGAPDKGQWLLLEVIERLAQNDRNIVVVSSSEYAETLVGTHPKVSVIVGPLDHYELGRLFRRTKIFLDASHHEGYGLLPMEAAMCGCHVVVSDSGGVRDLRDTFSVDILPLTADPAPFVATVENHLNNSVAAEPVAATNDLWANYNRNIEKWSDDIRSIIKDVSPRIIERSAQPATVFSLPLREQSGSLKRRVLEFAYRRYLAIKPYLPKRVTHAMRLLILGR